MSDPSRFARQFARPLQLKNVYTNSVMLSEDYACQHDDVLKTIKNLKCTEQFRNTNYLNVSWFDVAMNQIPAIEMTHAGFALVMTRLRGELIDQWVEKFVEQAVSKLT